MTRARFEIVCDTPNALWAFDKGKLRRVMRQAGAELSNVAKALMRASTGGRTYYNGRKGKRQASKPGAAPAVNTRDLIRSLKVSPFKDGLGVVVRATEFYGLMLEAGAQGGVPWGGTAAPVKTRRGLRNVYNKKTRERLVLVGRRVVLPRPFLSTALQTRQQSLGSRIVSAVQEGIKFQKIKP